MIAVESNLALLMKKDISLEEKYRQLGNHPSTYLTSYERLTEYDDGKVLVVVGSNPVCIWIS